MIRAGDRWLVGPDNGLLALAARAVSPLSAWHIDWRPGSLSDSFHGRDLFAPVAAALAAGNTVEASPVPLEELAGSGWPDDLPEVIYVDGFGNCITGIRGDQWDKGCSLHLSGRDIYHARTFCEVPAGAPFWYVNSLGLVEIAVNLGRADQCLQLAIGDVVRPG
jgi:S-adenosylmethionine hydrolase